MSGTIWRKDMMNNSGLTVSIKFDNFVVCLKIENYEIGIWYIS